jgi:hypothetical protein
VSTASVTLDPELRRLLAEAAAWRLAGLLFERPRAGWLEEVSALASEVNDPDLRTGAAHATAAYEGAYLAVLGPGRPLSPREAAWRPRQDPASILADVSAFYEAFAYRPRAEDPPDHVAVESGFAGFLRLKEAGARAAGEDDEAAVLASAYRLFLDEHLSVFAGPLSRRLIARGAPAWLAAAGMGLTALAGDRPDPLPLLATDEDEDRFLCGGCAG